MLKLYLGQELIIKSLFGNKEEIEFIVNKKTRAFTTIRFYTYNLQMDIPSSYRLNENDICRINQHMQLVGVNKTKLSLDSIKVRR